MKNEKLDTKVFSGVDFGGKTEQAKRFEKLKIRPEDQPDYFMTEQDLFEELRRESLYKEIKNKDEKSTVNFNSTLKAKNEMNCTNHNETTKLNTICSQPLYRSCVLPFEYSSHSIGIHDEQGADTGKFNEIVPNTENTVNKHAILSSNELNSKDMLSGKSLISSEIHGTSKQTMGTGTLSKEEEEEEETENVPQSSEENIGEIAEDDHISPKALISEWKPGAMKQREFCWDIDYVIDGVKVSLLAERREETMKEKWRKEDVGLMLSVGNAMGKNELFVCARRGGGGGGAKDGKEKEGNEEGEEEVEEKREMNDIDEDDNERNELRASVFSMKNEDFEGKMRKEQKKLVKKQIVEAKRYAKLFGRWIFKDWATLPEEKEMWRKAELSMMSDADYMGESKKQGENGNFEEEVGLTEEELKIAFAERKEKLDVNESEEEIERIAKKIAEKEKEREEEENMKGLSQVEMYIVNYVKEREKEAKKRRKKNEHVAKCDWSNNNRTENASSSKEKKEKGINA
ncbi:uncharacterized protein MONOS_14285 [Monocercomonoides exilis]|uniref:uncharacterized protein n=1 Tax=Monocercomonoides exilis TaxID=2049356 RepID=UPI003559FA92|nr:hypothetical protein MONOS_14285 [Monocercomonoides exilis]|eukprot:MONOS_14285.1-p1 / transcript=MONOS_14285.1 / gene=MONOS_14285 / organism=Monocercomonoides_exilis_PA203 / gene_product=unspecified product / transcript_product=unspecified product / location=Mono_scaffold00971:10833-12427(+) / protein_length=515 / sequence_SO=supercontig / SO=protein_coding / is_pseudo=false